MAGINLQRVSLLLAERVREIATRQGRVPFDRGDLRKSHVVQPSGSFGAEVGSNMPYARAVHDGRPALIIRPKTAKGLFWGGADHPVKSVFQPARTGRPWLRDAIAEMNGEPLDFLTPHIGPQATQMLADALQSLRSLHVKKG
ncbi:phage virion morphogenesis protein [Insolitispirillum peregrinum]|uniref:Phage protein, HK97 gp10 family n=1 Tax=Insolitispirillum peregrinum TaxID=80876 RepID=A0A1N7LSH0_9PROT|nr:HK97 gp10 family phage protein [Insolitispirillum peregrinum]SIS76651.1 hypothetical protein SAMN05421779_103523 [Insolitispirillum peregrinum]